jgi:hypothetical protein
MSTELEEFHHSFFQEIRARADSDGQFIESSFIEYFCEYLIDAGEFDALDSAHYRAPRGMRVDGYAGDPAENDGLLTLLIADFHQDDTVASLPPTDVKAIFRRLENFFSSALSPEFHEQLEETSPGYGLAEMICSRRSLLSRIRLFLLSNRNLSSRITGMADTEIDGIPVSYNVWDISRLFRLVSSRQGKEDIEIDLEEEFGQELPCLPAHVGGTSYEAYLAVVQGDLLARIYDRWGARLLEQNVRCFLQARGNVNKGIRNTIINDPEMFFAYNNGITATAEEVETCQREGVLRIRRLKNFQIVNGGQTTASLFTTGKKDKADLSHIFVQMKLAVVDPAQATEIVPKISEYANSQNRINAADFFANHPFHIRMEEFSRRLWAPSPDGSFRESKWFYERARGQYLDARANLTPAERRRFEQEFPKAQSFTKTDLAKFENVWEDIPYIVSKGAQHNFAHYATLIGQRWEKNADQFNEMYFRQAVAKAIIFRKLEKLVMEQPWYDGGYRANIVAYTIAKLSDLVANLGKKFDFDAVWKQQGISLALCDALVHVSSEVHNVIINPDAGSRNVTEWAKKPVCWRRVQALEIEIPKVFVGDLLDPSEYKASVKAATHVQKIDNGIEAQKKVLELGFDFWSNASSWAKSQRLLAEKDHQIMAIASTPSRLPTEKQCIHLMKVLEILKQETCPFLHSTRF